MSGRSRCALLRVDRPRHQLLAGAGLAGQQHRAARLGHALGAREQLADGAAVADDPVVAELDVALVEQVAQAESGPLILDGAPRDDQQFVHLERLLQVVAGAELHGLDGALDAAVRGHHHHGRPLALGRRADSSRMTSSPVFSGIR